MFFYSLLSLAVKQRNYTIREPDSLIIEGFASEIFCSNGTSDL